MYICFISANRKKKKSRENFCFLFRTKKKIYIMREYNASKLLLINLPHK